MVLTGIHNKAMKKNFTRLHFPVLWKEELIQGEMARGKETYEIKKAKK